MNTPTCFETTTCPRCSDVVLYGLIDERGLCEECAEDLDDVRAGISLFETTTCPRCSEVVLCGLLNEEGVCEECEECDES